MSFLRDVRSRRGVWIALIMMLATALLARVGALVGAARLCGVTKL
jgi:hypothetical protein